MTRDWELWENDNVVGSLDHYWRGWIFRRHREKVKGVLEMLTRRDPQSHTLLDFGCGTGNYAPIVRETGLGYSGVDVTEKMLAAARQRFPGIRFEKDDIFDSRQPDESFDIVMSCDVLVHLPDFHEPFRTLYRIARRHVVMKLPYLTQRWGPARWVLPERPTFTKRNQEGFIERLFNLEEVREWIWRRDPRAAIFHNIFVSGQWGSPYQAILVVSKPGIPGFA